MSYEQRRYTPEELERGRYLSEKIVKLLSRGTFSVQFDVLAGVMIGYAAQNGMTVLDVIKRIGWLTTHDSPDGRTTEELLAAFAVGKAS